MSVGIIAKKIGMDSVFVEDRLVPCTILETLACTVTQIKTQTKDGYNAVQMAGGNKKEKSATKALRGHCKKAGTSPKSKLVEFRNFIQDYPQANLKQGDVITADKIFEEQEFIDVTSISKGKGFCGVMKRHGFKGAKEATHGQKHTLKAPGSIGNVEEPVRKGKKMAGRTGRKTVKVKNLEVLRIMPEDNIIVLKGSVPGNKKDYIILAK